MNEIPSAGEAGKEVLEGALRQLRKRIDDVDLQILRGLNARAVLVSEVYALKRSHRVQRLDRDRTDEILERLVRENTGPLTASDVRDLYSSMLTYFLQRFTPGAER